MLGKCRQKDEGLLEAGIQRLNANLIQLFKPISTLIVN